MGKIIKELKDLEFLDRGETSRKFRVEAGANSTFQVHPHAKWLTDTYRPDGRLIAEEPQGELRGEDTIFTFMIVLPGVEVPDDAILVGHYDRPGPAHYVYLIKRSPAP